MTTDVIVTPWNSKPTEKNPDANLHDCLWEIAMEQAVLDRMKKTGEDFGTANNKVTPEDHMKQLDIVCQDNGFRKLGSTGSGRDPNLIFDGEKIKVRIDPATLMKSAPGVDGKPVSNAYTKAVQSETGQGPDLKKKEQLDQWLQTVSGFDKSPESERASLIEAYGRIGDGDRTKLAQLANSNDFKALDEGTRVRLLKLYGSENQSQSTASIDELIGKPGESTLKKLKLIGTEGFAVLTSEQQKRLLERYDKDKHFAAGLDQIIVMDNFTGKSGTAEAHALDILYRYAGRKHDGYGSRKDSEKTKVLVGLYDRVLAKPEFKLEDKGSGGKAETKDQSDKIDHYVKKEISEVLKDK